jgi:hypothetical protein
MVCLRSWDRSDITTLDEGWFASAVTTAIDDDDEHADLISENLLYHDNTQMD